MFGEERAAIGVVVLVMLCLFFGGFFWGRFYPYEKDLQPTPPTQSWLQDEIQKLDWERPNIMIYYSCRDTLAWTWTDSIAIKMVGIKLSKGSIPYFNIQYYDLSDSSLTPAEQPRKPRKERDKREGE